MSAMKRSSSSRLKSTKSEVSAAVTLFQLDDLPLEESPESPRRSKRVKTEPKVEAIPDLEDVVAPTSTPRKKATRTKLSQDVDAESPSKRDTKSPKKPKPIPQSLETPHPAPENWKEVYDTIKEMRSRIIAPVDTMGCDQAQLKESDPKNRRFATLVSLMLSSQTKDEVTDAAVTKLRAALGGSLSVAGIIAAPDADICTAIAKVGFWRRKAEYLKKTAIKLRDEFDSDVPNNVDDLCSLPGVGPKMAFLALQIAWNLNAGIGVDVHVHRITNLLKWHKPPTKTPEQTRLNLQSWLPKELHGEINHMLVGFGQVICVPVSPRCDVCELASNGLCPSARKVVVSKNRKEIVFIAKKEEDPQPLLSIKLEEEIMEESVKSEPVS